MTNINYIALIRCLTVLVYALSGALVFSVAINLNLTPPRAIQVAMISSVVLAAAHGVAVQVEHRRRRRSK